MGCLRITDGVEDADDGFEDDEKNDDEDDDDETQDSDEDHSSDTDDDKGHGDASEGYCGTKNDFMEIDLSGLNAEDCDNILGLVNVSVGLFCYCFIL